MGIHFDSQCLLCHLERNLEIANKLGSKEQAMAFARDLMQVYVNAPKEKSSPWFNPPAADLLHKHYGWDIDCYRQEKIDSNRFVMERLDTIAEKINHSDDPVFAGLQFAILGNYLDFSALRGNVSFEMLEDMLAKALEMELDAEIYQQFCNDLSKAKRMLYLTDNAGEIAFDRLFAEAIARKYPDLQITFCVRGGIATNDATREDAKDVGLPFPVIDNGNRVPGTQMDELSQEAQEAFDAADVIVAKGMGNCETMFGCGYNVYYAFLIKCKRFVSLFDKPLFTPMFIRDKK